MALTLSRSNNQNAESVKMATGKNNETQKVKKITRLECRDALCVAFPFCFKHARQAKKKIFLIESLPFTENVFYFLFYPKNTNSEENNVNTRRWLI